MTEPVYQATELQLLQEFLVDNPELEGLEEIAEDFNLFSALNLVDHEIRHSIFLSWLLNPAENHGLGDYFLASFLKLLAIKAGSLQVSGPSIFDIDRWHFDNSEVVREWRNIDILIRCDEPAVVCAIENKVHSAEHSEQLPRYAATVESEFPDHQRLFAYLTIEGDIPSDSRYVPVSYSDVVLLIERLLERRRGRIGSELFGFISHYGRMLRRHILKDSELQDICQKIYKRHRKALDLIFENRPDQLFDIHLLLVDALKRQGWILDESSKSYIHFITPGLDFIPHQGQGWGKIKRILLFEVYNTPDGVGLYLYIGPGPQEIRTAIYDVAQRRLDVFRQASRRKFTPQWFSIYKKHIMKPSEYEDVAVENVAEVLNNRLEALANDVARIESALQPLKAVFDDYPTQP